MADIVDLLCRTELEEFFSTHNAENEKKKGGRKLGSIPPKQNWKEKGESGPPPPPPPKKLMSVLQQLMNSLKKKRSLWEFNCKSGVTSI